MVIFSVVLLHRTRAILTVWTVRIVFVPYRTVLVRYAWKVRSKPYKDGATVQHDSDRNLAVWLLISAQNISRLYAAIIHDKLLDRNQVLRLTLSFHASHYWALPPSWCSLNPASGSFLEAFCGVSTREEHTGERKWEVSGQRGHSEAIFALAVPAWHRTVYRTVDYRN